MAQAAAQDWLVSREFVQSVLDALPQHIAVLDRRGEIVATNAAWRRFGRENGLSEQGAPCIGIDYLAVCDGARGRHAESADAAAAGIRAIADGERTSFELEYPCSSDTEERWFVMRVSPFGGAGRRWLVVTHDNMTEQRLAERAAREATEQRRLALEAADLGTWDSDLISGRIFWDERCRAIFGAASDPADLDQALATLHPDDRAAARRAFEVAVGPAGQGSYEIEKRILRPDGTVRWVSAKGRVAFTSAGVQRRPARITGVVADITDRRHAEERQQLLLRELNHRVRNMLATVQSVAASTARTSASLADFERAFARRLDALARTHTLLAAAEWQATGVRSLIGEAVAPYRAAHDDNVSLHGDDVQLPANMALPLSLILHELATNAAKYGALSAPGGRIEVSWHAEAIPAGRCLVLEWTERGGPEVRAPTRSGFGRTLIERSVAYELGGKAELEFAPGGVRCHIKAPLETEP